MTSGHHPTASGWVSAPIWRARGVYQRAQLVNQRHNLRTSAAEMLSPLPGLWSPRLSPAREGEREECQVTGDGEVSAAGLSTGNGVQGRSGLGTGYRAGNGVQGWERGTGLGTGYRAGTGLGTGYRAAQDWVRGTGQSEGRTQDFLKGRARADIVLYSGQ